MYVFFSNLVGDTLDIIWASNQSSVRRHMKKLVAKAPKVLESATFENIFPDIGLQIAFKAHLKS